MWGRGPTNLYERNWIDPMVERNPRGHAEFMSNLERMIWNQLRVLVRDVGYRYGPVSREELADALNNVERRLRKYE